MTPQVKHDRFVVGRVRGEIGRHRFGGASRDACCLLRCRSASNRRAAESGKSAADISPTDCSGASGSDESEQHSQAAAAYPLGHRSSHQRGDQLTVALGVEQQHATVDPVVSPGPASAFPQASRRRRLRTC